MYSVLITLIQIQGYGYNINLFGVILLHSLSVYCKQVLQLEGFMMNKYNFLYTVSRFGQCHNESLTTIKTNSPQL